jgi:hypothetical protein
MTTATATVPFATPAGLTARRIRKQPAEPSQAAAPSGSPKLTARVQFEVSSKSLERLELLKKEIEAKSYAEVIKNALRLYELLIKERAKGSQFVVRDLDGNLSPLPLSI